MAKKKQEQTDPLKDSIKKIENLYGKGSIMKLDDRVVENVSVISTGSIKLDKALGVGGYPRGRIVEVFGPESVGKSTFALHAIANVQKNNGNVALIEPEHAFDRMYAEKLNVQLENLYLSQPDYGEQALEIADHLIRSGKMDIVVIDSVAALTPKKELEGEMGDSSIGLQARLMSQAMRKIAANVGSTKTTVMFINQLREKIGVMFGSPYVTSGGNALKFYSSVRLDIKRMGQIKQGEDEIIGHMVRVNVVKNKLASPFKKAEFEIIYGQGISKAGEIIDLGIEYGVLQKSGSWYSYEKTKLGQGRENVRCLLNDNLELMDDIEKKIKQKMG